VSERTEPSFKRVEPPREQTDTPRAWRSTARGLGQAPVLDRPPFRWTRRDQHSLPVHTQGSLPGWLTGELVRTAPAVFAAGSFRAEHWFDGLGLVYGFSFGEQVRFQQRLLESRVAQDIAQGRERTGTFDTTMKRGFFRRLMQPVPQITDNTNVNIVPWQGAWLAMTESPHQHVVGDDLASRGLYHYEDALPSGLSLSAHPHFDFVRNAQVNVGTTFGAKSELWVVRQSADGRAREVEGKLALKRVPYVHAFGLTAKHALIIDQPLSVNPLSMLWSNRGFIDHFKWQPERGTRLWKLNRESGVWTDYQTEALFCFHIVNTFDDGDDVVLDFLAFDDPSIIETFKTERLAAGALPSLLPRFVRARLSPGKRHAELELLSEQRFDLPNIAYRQQQGQRYSAVWGAVLAADSQHGQSGSEIVRVDVESDSVVRFSEPDTTYGEPVFVPRPGATCAHEGVVLTVGSHAVAERSTLAVLDATTLEPLARCHVDLSIPLGFHGTHRG
jgi:carotenoid cleavage dioxygenase-like enzyme